MRSILAVAFASFSLMIGTAALESAKATINQHQEKTADAICNVDPTICGQSR